MSTQSSVTWHTGLRMGGHGTSILYGLPALIQQTLKVVDAPVAWLAEALLPQDNLYCLGYGLTYTIALEGALKSKGITTRTVKISSRPSSSRPLSAVYDGYPALFVAGSEDAAVLVRGINEVTCRGGRALAFDAEDSRLRNNASDVIVIPDSDAHFNPILAVLPLQLLSYRVSVGRGYDPDFPCNLSKTLTVD